MKGAKLNTVILTWLSIVSIAIMLIGAWAESWSQLHKYDFDFLLYATLGSIVTIFMIRSLLHEDKDFTAFRLGSMEVREKHLNRIVSYMFLGVLVFGVNSDLKIVSFLHYPFTGLAILFAYISFYTYQTTKVGRFLSILGIVIGIGGFAWGFFTDALSIAEGEALAAFPIVVWILLTNKLKE